VLSEFVEQQSDPAAARFIFTYTVWITNSSDDAVTLRKRHWLITNSDNSKITVDGDGVVGKQPLIPSRKCYHYTSGVVLNSPVGTMEGHYLMEKNNGDTFKVPIPAFLLAVPNTVN
jgi:ApaG protein